jgi:hypothetical protein
MSRIRAERNITLGLLLATGVVIAGCQEGAGTTTTGGLTPPDQTTAAPSEGAVEVALVDYAFVGLPASVEAGTTLTVVNQSEAEVHELVAFRLPEGEERTMDELVGLPEEDLGPILGEPATVLIAPPGGPMIPAVGDGTLSEPGRYLILCFIPTGADPEEYMEAAQSGEGPPDVAGGPPHFVNGMRAELTVSQ